jgi:hypothetical protein
MAFIRWQVDWNDIHPSGMERERERQTDREGESRLCHSPEQLLVGFSKETCPPPYRSAAAPVDSIFATVI